MNVKKFEQITAQAMAAVNKFSASYQATSRSNHEKVLNAFRRHRVGYHHFSPTNGYGLGDSGRDTLEDLWSDVFEAEDSLLRQQIISGTHAISLGLFGLLLPGDEMVIYGEPYDTLHQVLGRTEKDVGSLRELGIRICIHPFGEWKSLTETVSTTTKVFYIQRSRGYALRPALTIDEIGQLIRIVRTINPKILVFVDNCYGEFVEEREPLAVGADLIAGSLIKNAGGTIAPAGGYLCGRRDLVERVAFRLTAPGIGKEIGPSLISNTALYQGLYFAPMVVREALKSAVYISTIFAELGYEVMPTADEKRSDIVQMVYFNDAERLKAFCRGVQRYSAVDSHVLPEDWDMPGYEDRVIMASGGFVQGSSIEFSVDAPMRPPYVAFAQGGASFEYVKLAIDGILRNDFLIE